MLRECMEREALAKILLGDAPGLNHKSDLSYEQKGLIPIQESPKFFCMFDYIVLDSFDISSDAHRTFRVSFCDLVIKNACGLTKHKPWSLLMHY